MGNELTYIDAGVVSNSATSVARDGRHAFVLNGMRTVCSHEPAGSSLESQCKRMHQHKSLRWHRIFGRDIIVGMVIGGM
jgi:hypothetical protein